MRAKRWKKANIHKRYVRNFTLHWQSSRWKACETHLQQTYVNGFWLWIESYIREFRESKIYDIFTFFLAAIHYYVAFPLADILFITKERNRYLFPKYRVTHIWAKGSVMDIHRVVAGRYFYPGTLIYTVNKTDLRDIWNIDERSHKHPDNLNTNRGK